jgi:hypothetical protein
MWHGWLESKYYLRMEKSVGADREVGEAAANVVNFVDHESWHFYTQQQAAKISD